MNRHLFRVLIVLLALLLVISCTTPTTNSPVNSTETEGNVAGGTTQNTPAATSAPEAPGGASDSDEAKEQEWDDPYAQVKAELCGPDAPAEARPTFTEPLPARVEQAGGVREIWIQRGLYANPQGELFRVDVTGSAPDRVARYTEELRLCLDQRFTGEIAEEQQALPGAAQPSVPETFGENKEDLIIEFYLAGFVGQGAPDATIKRLIGSPVEQWAVLFRELGLTPDQARPEEANQEYVIDFVIDPSVSGGGTHRYAERGSVKEVVATISVANGSGSVRATLCRNGVSLLGRTVTKGGTQTDGLSNTSNSSVTYDLGVTGNGNGTYQVSGRLGVPGWNSGYLDPYGASGGSNCPP